ncbi:hypothetical protein P4E94_15405, partial [Pontiellaceae bacterium B12219]|nr:hypothetical protein [Pontiellaceae bacterium B12219]
MRQMCKMAAVLFLLSGLAGLSAEAGEITDGLIAHYKFDGNASDSSGNGYDGTVYGADVDGHLSLAGSAESYAQLPHTLFDGVSNFTFSVYCRLDENYGGYLLSCAGSESGNELLLGYICYDQVWEIYHKGGGYRLDTESTLLDYDWHHVVMTRSNGLCQVWCDGVGVGSTNLVSDALVVAENGVILGQDQDSIGGGFQSQQAWRGDMDDLRIYHRVISAEERSQLGVAGDIDQDGLSNLMEVELGLDAAVSNAGSDLDGDGLLDLDEVNVYGTHLLKPDTDGDGLSDGDEVNEYNTDPLQSDTDDDGLSDGDELNTSGTDPLNADCDEDGILDGDEVANGLDPLSDNTGSDLDEDGILDGDEVANGLDPFSDNAGSDLDGDGLLDGEEVNTYGTDPLLADSDGDG